MLLGRPLDEQLATEVALAGGVGFCGSLACLPVSWWLVSIPTLIAILVLGDSIALPALGIAATAFLPIWAGFSGAAAAGGRMAGQLILAPEGTATNEANTTQPMAPMRY